MAGSEIWYDYYGHGLASHSQKIRDVARSLLLALGNLALRNGIDTRYAIFSPNLNLRAHRVAQYSRHAYVRPVLQENPSRVEWINHFDIFLS